MCAFGMRAPVLCSLISALFGFGLVGQLSAESGPSRDPWLWPFATDSIWNMPIGSDAKLIPAKIPTPAHIGCDLEWHIRTEAEDPVYPVFAPSSWGTRWPGERKLGELRIPADLIIPDAKPPHTPNACAAFLMPDGRTIRQLEPACRPVAEPRIVGYLHGEDQDLYGAGIKGTHYGSGLSAIGGSIRPGELTGDAPIRHALKLNVWAKYLHYSDAVPGFRWPADRCDSYARESYHGKNPSLVMGALLVLPSDLKPLDLDVRTEVGLKLFEAFQGYGAYISDDTAWDASDLCVERSVPHEVAATYGYTMTGTGPLVEELKRIIPALMIVENNSPEQIGGGGLPIRPLAPELIAP